MRESRELSPLQGFVENRGQWGADVRFFARAGRVEATLTNEAIVLRPCPDFDAREWAAPLVLRLGQSAAPMGEAALPTRHHFLIGDVRAHDVPGYERVVYRGAWPGVDLVFRRDGASFAYDLHFAAGAPVEAVALEIEGVTAAPSVSGNVLELRTRDGIVEHRVGACYELDPSGKHRDVGVAVHATAGEALRIAFSAPDRDLARPFVLDPSFVFGTYVGGPNQELIYGLDVDAAGATYLTCRAHAGAPTTPGAVQPFQPGLVNAWVGKLSPDGSALEWGTYLGGNDVDVSQAGVCVDTDGTVVVAGHTWSPNFPVTPGAVQTTPGGPPNQPGPPMQSSDLFVTRLTPDGSAIVASTRYGGTTWELGYCFDLFPNGDVVVGGEAYKATLPGPASGFDTHFDAKDQLIVRFDRSLSTVQGQTYFATSRIDDLQVGPQGDVFICGVIDSSHSPLPTTPGAFQQQMVPGDTGNGFVAKFNESLSVLQWSTHFGSHDKLDFCWALDVDAANAVYVTGHTDSDQFSSTPGAFGTTTQSGGSYVAKLLPNGAGPAWCSVFDACCGGSFTLKDVRVDAAGRVTVTGSSIETSYPTTSDAFKKTKPGGFLTSDLVLTQLDALGEALVYSTWFGGPAAAEGEPYLMYGPDDSLTMAFYTNGSDVPTTPGAYDRIYAGGSDLAVARFQMGESAWEILPGGITSAVNAPMLAGKGSLLPGSSGKLSIAGAPPNGVGILFLGATVIGAPVGPGTFVPSPDISIVVGLDGTGSLSIPFLWPQVPAGAKAYVQAWIADPGAELGFVATNALKLVSR